MNKLVDMINDGALVAIRESNGYANGSRFFINFNIVREKYPEEFENLVLLNLNDIEKVAYKLGYFDYEIMPDGSLMWSFVR